MACNCTTEEEINKLYESYSMKMRERGDNFKSEAKRILLFICSIFMWIIAFPLMLLYVIVILIWEDKPKINIQTINLMRIYKFFKDV